MENIKVFFIALFTCSKREDVKLRRQKKILIRNYQTQKQIQFYDTYQRLDNDNTSETSSIFYPNDEVYID